MIYPELVEGQQKITIYRYVYSESLPSEYSFVRGGTGGGASGARGDGAVECGGGRAGGCVRR